MIDRLLIQIILTHAYLTSGFQKDSLMRYEGQNVQFFTKKTGHFDSIRCVADPRERQIMLQARYGFIPKNGLENMVKQQAQKITLKPVNHFIYECTRCFIL